MRKTSQCKHINVLDFYRTQVSLGSDLWVPISLTPTPFADLTDVTLADEDSNLIPTDDVHRAILGNVPIQVAPFGARQVEKKLRKSFKK